MEQINLTVIGCGYWGPNLIRNFMDIPEVNLQMVVDVREERLEYIQRRYPALKVAKDLKAMHALAPDAVVIATPPPTHYQIAKECLMHGYHVLVEKPMTLHIEEAEELIDIAAQNNLILMVGHTFEFNSAVRALRELVCEGELGQIYYVDTARLNLGLFQNNLNVLWDLAPHDISILLYILDELPVRVNAQGVHCVFPGIYDVVYLNLEFQSNILAHIHVSWLDPCKVRRVTIVGSQKMVVYNDVESLEKIKLYDKGVVTPVYTDTFREFNCSYRYGDVLIPYVPFIEPLKLECQHFVDCIIQHVEPCTCGHKGLQVVKILEAAQKSLTNCGHMEEIQW